MSGGFRDARPYARPTAKHDTTAGSGAFLSKVKNYFSKTFQGVFQTSPDSAPTDGHHSLKRPLSPRLNRQDSLSSPPDSGDSRSSEDVHVRQRTPPAKRARPSTPEQTNSVPGSTKSLDESFMRQQIADNIRHNRPQTQEQLEFFNRVLLQETPNSTSHVPTAAFMPYPGMAYVYPPFGMSSAGYPVLTSAPIGYPSSYPAPGFGSNYPAPGAHNPFTQSLSYGPAPYAPPSRYKENIYAPLSYRPRIRALPEPESFGSKKRARDNTDEVQDTRSQNLSQPENQQIGDRSLTSRVPIKITSP